MNRRRNPPLGPPAGVAPIDLSNPWTENYSCPAWTDKAMAEASVFLIPVVITETANAQPYGIAHLCMGIQPAWSLKELDRLSDVKMARSRGESIIPTPFPEFITNHPAESAERAIDVQRNSAPGAPRVSPPNASFGTHIPDIGHGMYPYHRDHGTVSVKPTTLYGLQPQDIDLHVLDDDTIVRRTRNAAPGVHARPPLEPNIEVPAPDPMPFHDRLATDGEQYEGATPVNRPNPTIDEALKSPHIQANSEAFLAYTRDAEERADRVVDFTDAIIMLARLALERRSHNLHMLRMTEREPRYYDDDFHGVYLDHQSRDEECDLMIVQIASSLSIRQDWFRGDRRRAMRNYLRLRDHAFIFDGHQVIANPAGTPFLFGSDYDPTLPVDYLHIHEIIRSDYMAASIMIAPYAWYRLPEEQNPFGLDLDIAPPGRGMDSTVAATALSVLRATYTPAPADEDDHEARQRHLLPFQHEYRTGERQQGQDFQAFAPLPPLIPPFQPPAWPYTFYVPLQRQHYDPTGSRTPFLRPIHSRRQVDSQAPIFLVPVNTDLRPANDPWHPDAAGHDDWYHITRNYTQRTMPSIRNLPHFDFGHNNRFFVTQDRPNVNQIGTIGHRDPWDASLAYFERPSPYAASARYFNAGRDIEELFTALPRPAQYPQRRIAGRVRDDSRPL